MAATVQQQQTQEESAARAFWNAKMQKHPNIAGALAIAGEVAGFFLNGHFIVATSRWMIRVGGSVAESALLFAVLWISATSVAPQLLELVMSEKTMQSLVSIALIVLALIPEIILANAIVNAVAHWLTVAHDRYNSMAWVWAIAFTIPTLLFLYLTAYTLNTLAANGGNFVQASTGMVGLRCFAGWSYGLLEMVYAGVGRKTVSQAQAVITPAQPAPAAAPSVPAQPLDYEEIARHLLPLVAQVIPDTTGMLEQLRADVERLTQRRAKPPETVRATEDETNITSFEDAKFHFSQKIDETEMETETGREPRTTGKLKQERSTTKRETTNETRRGTNTSRGAARQKALRAIKKNPDMNATELAKRAGITPQYAGQILKQQSVNQ